MRACALALVLVAALTGPAHAADDDGLQRIDLGATVTAGFGRGAGSGACTLLEIVFSPQVPIAGHLEVSSMGMTRGGALREVEVSAGATKVFHLLLPPADEVQAAFVATDGTRIGLPRPEMGGSEDVFVGAIGAAPALPSPLNTVGLDRAIRGVPVDPAVLDLGPRALQALDALVLPSSDLTAMSEEHRRSVAVAVSTGLDLLVPVRAGSGPLPLPWNPLASASAGADGRVALVPADDAWAASPADLGIPDGGQDIWVTATSAGRGRVVALAGAPGDGGTADRAELWSHLLQPRADLGMPLGTFDDGDLGNRLFGGGSTLPGILGAVAFLTLYLLLIGPVNALFVRRRGRRELSWVTIPAVTVVFTAIAAFTAAGGGATATPVIRAAWWLDGVGQEITALTLQAPSRGTHHVVYPGPRDAMLGSSWSQATSFNSFDGDETTFSASLEALQTTTAVAYGPPGAAAPLDVTARFDDGVLTVSATNRTDTPLAEVRVLAATTTTDVGELAPGEARSITIDDLEPTLPPPPGERNLRMLGRGMRAGPDGPAEDTPGPDSAERLLSWTLLDRSPGAVWVTATSTDDLGLVTPQVAGPIDDRGAFVAVGVTPDHTGATVLPHEVRRDLLRRGVWMLWRQQPLSIEGEAEAVLRYRLPDPDALGTLVSTLDAGGVVRPMDMNMHDPWREGCFSVTEIDAEGNQSDAEERCGEQIACPPDATECGGDEQRLEACFPDGSCQIAERVPDAESAEPTQDGFEIFDRIEGDWVAASTVFDEDGRADPGRVVSPLGEVLIRARNVGFLPFGQRGLGVEGAA